MIVVHHRRHSEIGGVVEGLIHSGLQPEQIIVVDNSETPDCENELLASLPHGVECLFTVNRGYAAAVNEAASWISSTRESVRVVLVATHEVRFVAGSPMVLLDAVRDPQIGAVGPLLVVPHESRTLVWSEGGQMSTWLRIPTNRGRGREWTGLANPRSLTADWLDGACVAYRLETLAAHPMDESFFMYFEEVEYHHRLRQMGLSIKLEPSVVVAQSTNGVKPLVGGRNLQRYLLLHGSRFAQIFTVRYIAFRSVLGSIRHRRNFAASNELLAGRREAMKARASRTP